MRSVLFCSESHVAKKSLRAEKDRKVTRFRALHHPHTNEHGQYVDGQRRACAVPLAFCRDALHECVCQDWRIARVCVSLPVSTHRLIAPTRTMLPSIEQRLAQELSAKPAQVAAAVALLDEGATVPFIARYRKEATGGLDDIQLRLLEERLRYLRELEDRRAAIIASITEQNKMTPELLQAITLAEDKTRLEDLYLPYKQKRRTKAQIAIEAGLAPLADGLLADPALNPESEAANIPARSVHQCRRREQPRRGRHQGRAGRRAPDPDGALRRRRRAAAVAARIRAGARRGRVEGRRGQAGRRREVRRLLRLFGNAGHRARRTARWR